MSCSCLALLLSLSLSSAGDPDLDFYVSRIDCMRVEVRDVRLRFGTFASAICLMADEGAKMALVARRICSEATVRQTRDEKQRGRKMRDEREERDIDSHCY
jgi:hypothetical protein